MQQLNVPEHLVRMGQLVQDGWKQKAQKHNMDIHVSGIYPLSHFGFKVGNPLLHKTVFTKIMLEYGFLASTIYYASYAHKEHIVNDYLIAVDKSFERISKMNEAELFSFVNGKICHGGFKRLN